MRKINLIYLSFFTFILFAPLTANIVSYERELPGRFQQIREARKLKLKSPVSFSRKGIKNFLTYLERWYKNRYGLQNELTKANALLYRALGTSPQKGRYLFGNNNFIYMGENVNNVVSQSMGKHVFSTHELQKRFENIQKIADYFENRKIPFYIAIAPNKHSVYPEYLPSYLKKEGPTKYDQIISYNSNPLDIINLRDTMLKAKKSYGDLLFLKSDSHWSELGSYVAYCLIVNRIKQDFPDLRVLELDEYFVKEDNTGGDLAFNCNLLNSARDHKIQLKFQTKPDSVQIKLPDGKRVNVEPLYNTGLGEFVVIENKNQKYRLLFIRDSFGRRISYLNQSFGEVFHLYSQSKKVEEIDKILKEFKPDLVLFEFVERYLNRRVIEPDIWEDIDCFNRAKSFVNYAGESIFESVYKMKFINVLEKNKSQVAFETTNNKRPRLFFDFSGLPQSKRYLIKIVQYVPVETTLILYYKTHNDKSFRKENSVWKKLQTGWNNIYINISDKNLSGIFRCDLGCALGHYRLKSFEIRYLSVD